MPYYKYSILALFLCLLVASDAFSENTLNTLGLSKDKPASVAYSLRRLSSEYNGPAIKVKRSSDSTEQDIYFIGLKLNIESLYKFCGSASCFVTKWYDQSGNDHHATPVNNNVPRIVNNGKIETKKNRPTIYFNFDTSQTPSSSNVVALKTDNFTAFESEFTLIVAAGSDSPSSTSTTYVSKTNLTGGPYPWDMFNSKFLTPKNTNQGYKDCGLSHAINTQDSFGTWTFGSREVAPKYEEHNGAFFGLEYIIRECNYAATPSSIHRDAGNPLIIGSRNDYLTSLNGWISEVIVFPKYYITQQTTYDISNNTINYFSNSSLDLIGLTSKNKPSVAYSLRLLSSRYLGPAIEVVNSLNVTKDIGFISGNLDLATLEEFCRSQDCHVTKWYDQSGSGFHATPINEHKPKIVSNGNIEMKNGQPTIYFNFDTTLTPDATNVVGLKTKPFTAFNAGYSIFTASGTRDDFAGSIHSSALVSKTNDIGGPFPWDIYDGNSLTGRRNSFESCLLKKATNSTGHFGIWSFGGSSGNVSDTLNNKDNKGACNTVPYQNNNVVDSGLPIVIGSRNDHSTAFNGWVSEVIIFPEEYNTSDTTNNVANILSENQSNHFSIFFNSDPIFFLGPTCNACTVSQGIEANNYEYEVNCPKEEGGSNNNTVVYDPDVSSILVNNNYTSCTKNVLHPVNVANPTGCPSMETGSSNWIHSQVDNQGDNQGVLSNITCNINTGLTFYGPAQQTCTPTHSVGSDNTINYSCINGVSHVSNTVKFLANAPEIIVNGFHHRCETDLKANPLFIPDKHSEEISWFSAENANGVLTNVKCNIPIPTPQKYTWSSPLNNVYDKQIDNNLVEIKSNMTLKSAFKYAMDQPVISYFYYGDNGSNNLEPDQAAFFTGIPNHQSSSGSQLYQKLETTFYRDLKDHIFSYYPFDVNGNDVSGMEHHADLESTLFELGHHGNAISFSTDSTFANIPPKHGPYDLGYSIAFWMKIERELSSTSEIKLMGPLSFLSSSNEIKYKITSQNELISKSKIPRDTWTHVAVSYDKNKLTMKMYIDGEISDDKKLLGALPNSFSPWGDKIGGIPISPPSPYVSFSGSIDELFLYDRPLSLAEINFLAGIRHSSGRGFYPMSSQEEKHLGEPGYSPRYKSDILSSGGMLSHYYCGLNKQTKNTHKTEVSDHLGICECPYGYQEKTSVYPGTGCEPRPISVASFTITEKKQRGRTNRKEIIINNARNALMAPVRRDKLVNIKRLETFVKKYCGNGIEQRRERGLLLSKNGINIDTACQKTSDKNYDHTCTELNITVKVKDSESDLVLSYPNYTVEDWAADMAYFMEEQEFIVVTANFFSLTRTGPCGLPLGLISGMNEEVSEYKEHQFEAFEIQPDLTTEWYYKLHSNSNVSDNSHAISGLAMRINGEKQKINQFPQALAKPDVKSGRTVLGYDKVNNRMKIVVIKKEAGKKGYTPEEVLNLYPQRAPGTTDGDDYRDVLLLDGGGSAGFVHWKSGESKLVYAGMEKDDGTPGSGLKYRAIPSALLIAIPGSK